MSDKSIDKAYISPHDKFFHYFDRSHPLSASQEREIKKAEKIAKLRDIADPKAIVEPLCQDF